MNSNPDVKAAALEGAPNFRDLGGLPVSGGRIRHGLLFRSEGLSGLTEKGLADLDALGIRLVCDLRGADERVRKPTSWAGARPRVLAIEEGLDLYGSDEEHIRTAYRDETGESVRTLIADWYADMHRIYAPVLRELFSALADRGELPALVHCTGGKDRTGFVTAMLLSALGASRAVVEADYLMTDQFFGPPRLRQAIEARLGQAASTNVVDGLRVSAGYLDAMFSPIEAKYGSVDDYLRHVGLDDKRRDVLRRRLIA